MRDMKLLLVVAAIVVVAGGMGVCQSGEPIAAEWQFKLDKVWEMRQVGGDTLLRPAEPRVADDGTLYVRDFERQVSYAISADGQSAIRFASQGNEDGQVPFYLNCGAAGECVAVCAPDKIHFFSKRGQFIKAAPNNLFVRFPLAFADENSFWVAPGALGDAPGPTATVTHVDLAAGEETVVHEFARTDEESIPTGGAMVLGLTPQMLMAYDRKSDRVYFGKNSDTVIYWRAVDGSRSGSFWFSGARRSVTEADKRDHFARFDIPEEHLTRMIAMLPDHMTFYSRIQVVGDRVYLFGAEEFGSRHTGLEVNVYTPEGQHAYVGRLGVEEGWYFASPDCVQMIDGFVYAVLQDEAGEKKIVKYTVSLPEE